MHHHDPSLEAPEGQRGTDHGSTGSISLSAWEWSSCPAGTCFGAATTDAAKDSRGRPGATLPRLKATLEQMRKSGRSPAEGQSPSHKRLFSSRLLSRAGCCRFWRKKKKTNKKRWLQEPFPAQFQVEGWWEAAHSLSPDTKHLCLSTGDACSVQPTAGHPPPPSQFSSFQAGDICSLSNCGVVGKRHLSKQVLLFRGSWS